MINLSLFSGNLNYSHLELLFKDYAGGAGVPIFI